MKTVLITGGSGLVGRALSDLLLEKGYKVIWLSRERYVKADIPRYRWDYRKGEIDEKALEQADIVIHLAGSNLSEDSWTRAKKQRIVESRVKSAALILAKWKEMDKKPEAFISASAVGIYGNDISDEVLDESADGRMEDFLSRTCRKWEAEAQRFTDELGARSVMVRQGVVLSGKSDAFRKMLFPTRYGLGARMGNGRQYMSWIHIDDLCAMYLKAIEDAAMQGPYNAVAPEFMTNTEFMRTLARVLRKPFFLPRYPAFFMRLFMGEAADMLLGGSRISSEKIRKAGFEFRYPSAEQAIKACVDAVNKEVEEKRSGQGRR
ncbi:TIGR01777 family oxidoreductase [Limibacterium fermenti]|uniref:TIGR01777 family oxidoreductase n=1 Tax=Limibacterium fermenti TaxID=3229863 RepID=UPI003A7A0086